MALKYTIEEAVTAWRRASQIVFYNAGRLSIQDDVVDVAVVASQRNLAKEESIRFQTHFIVQKSNLNLLSQTPSSDISTEKLIAFGSKSNVTAIIRETPDTKSSEKKNKQILEIWKDNCLWNSVDLQHLDKHGKVYTDGTFGCLEFSPDEKHLVYLAEKKEPKKQSFLQFGVASSAEGSKVGTEYDFVEDWGEQLVGKSQPVICIYKVNWEPFQSEDAVRILEASDEWSPGQLVWCSNEHLAGVAWYHQPRRLGIIYCSNRPSQIFKVDVSSGKYDWFGLKRNTAASPRHHAESNTLVYLTSLAYGPHHKEQQIAIISPDGTVQQVHSDSSESYQGMYNQSFPERCWSSDGKLVFFTTPCKSSVQSYALVLDSFKVHKLSLPDGCTGSVVLDVFQDLILVCGVSLTRPDQLFIGRFDPARVNEAPIQWKGLSGNNVLPSAHSLATDVLSFKPEDDMEYEASLVFPKNASKKTPLIVVPHGGPHAVSTDQFKSEVYFFSQLGYAVLFVNYRGSTGFGEKSLYSLLGKVGVQDVQEVHHATVQMVEKHSEVLDKELVFLFGGSHGGFLVTHLSGQYPDFYRAVSTRNPVIDMASMFPITDIADWTIVESGLGDGSELENLLELQSFSRMWEFSPIRYAKQVKAPTLLLVGKVDRRVPPTQSIEYYRALKLSGIKTRMILYEDCHSLSQVPVDTDALINTVLWFQESLQ
uniref:acylaminoacyl-peptidase n=1 Tax=Daphnia magna TaxID=35525 RepID=A0A0P5PDY1_9CRUS